MNAPVVRRAPGKFLIAGEYAALVPGQPAVVAAVDRYVTVTAAPAEHADVELVTGPADEPVLLRRGHRGLAPHRSENTSRLRSLSHLLAVLATVDQLALELGLPLTRVRMTVQSDLHERGVKIGAGSSGAVTAAATAALADFRGLRLTPEARLRLALLATLTADPHASGADVAASTWGGWIRYTGPDREELHSTRYAHGVALTLRARWPGLSLRSMAPPPGPLHVGWTGSPASTPAQVARLQNTPWWNSEAHHRFLTDSGHVVDDLAHALDHADQQAATHALGDARKLLGGLDRQTSIGVFTPMLTTLCESAEAVGGSGKPSGAGGGDCGIALLPAHADPRPLHRLWTAAGITPLPVRTAPCSAPLEVIGPDPARVLPVVAAPTPRTAP
ncbi:phosphomevalonate kinase [Streptomyces beigongshangae]|uniref:phosphomevalonate kinase n=1 Tax=Streptomyces beigongshangae TaxID=2841597 RepID=UPI001C859BA8|nr:phosphomevalonate kinase [Streptomyces sp. REN17]